MTKITEDKRTLLDRQEVLSLMCTTSSTLYRYIRERDFPKPSKLIKKSWWDERAVKLWIDSQYQ
jgi:predicted DNA-binding transcriptional regulator AlpA